MKSFIVPVIFVALMRLGQAGPLRIQKRAAFYIANETACVVDNTVYFNGDPIPTDDPCEACKCRPPGFACVLKECEKKPGCRAVRRAGQCCPEYVCGCEHNGRMYRDGDEIQDSKNPCYTCHCQGSSIACAFVDCFFRVDCAPEYIQGECCPHYNHCSSIDPKNSYRTETPFTRGKEPNYGEITTESETSKSNPEHDEPEENTSSETPEETFEEEIKEIIQPSEPILAAPNQIQPVNLFSVTEDQEGETNVNHQTTENEPTTQSIQDSDVHTSPNAEANPESDSEKQTENETKLLKTGWELNNFREDKVPEIVFDDDVSLLSVTSVPKENSELFTISESHQQNEKIQTDPTAELKLHTNVPDITEIAALDENAEETNDIKRFRSLENGGVQDNIQSDKTETNYQSDDTEIKDPSDGTEIKDPSDGTEIKDQLNGTEIIDQLNCTEISDQSDGTEIEGRSDGTEVKDQSNDTEITDQAESTEIIDQANSTEIKDQSDGIQYSEALENTKITDQADSTEIIHQAVSTEIKNQAEITETLDQTESTNIKDQTESTNIKDQTENTNIKDQTESEKTEVLKTTEMSVPSEIPEGKLAEFLISLKKSATKIQQTDSSVEDLSLNKETTISDNDHSTTNAVTKSQNNYYSNTNETLVPNQVETVTFLINVKEQTRAAEGSETSSPDTYTDIELNLFKALNEILDSNENEKGISDKTPASQDESVDVSTEERATNTTTSLETSGSEEDIEQKKGIDSHTIASTTVNEIKEIENFTTEALEKIATDQEVAEESK